MTDHQAYKILLQQITDNEAIKIIMLNGCYNFDDLSDQEFQLLAQSCGKLATSMIKIIKARMKAIESPDLNQ